jgi:hypothetical protein
MEINPPYAQRNVIWPTSTDIDMLLAFLPVFDCRTYDPLKPGSQITNSISLHYNAEVRRFFQLLDAPCWADYQYMPGEVAKQLQDDQAIAKASLEELRSLLTYCNRAERFCNGAWKSILTNGKMVAILRRLGSLRDGAS